MAKSKKDLSRKEKRKLERKAIKQNRSVQNRKTVEIAQLSKIGQLRKILNSKIEATNRNKNIEKESRSLIISKKYVDPYIEAEEKEIERLSKLLGFDKNISKNKIAGKLNKEFQLYEGLGEDFGDFLNDLDELTDVLEGKVGLKNKKGIFYKGSTLEGDDDDDDDDSVFAKEDKIHGHLIDDDQQEESDMDEGDIDAVDSDIDEEEEDEEEEDDMNENEVEKDDNTDDDDNNNTIDDDDDEIEDGNFSEENDENETNNDYQEVKELFTYKPIEGEDIYGRSLPASDDQLGQSNKYVPPAKRKAATMIEVDNSAEKVVALRRQFNGLMNKLSDQTKDTIIRSIKKLFDQNSVTISSLVLKDTILAACSNPTQLMTTLIPIYAAIVAALHCTVGVDVGAFIIESLATVLYKSIGEATLNANIKDTISSKLPANALLLLVYLYNLRIVHHTLIVDIMKVLADSSAGEFAELKIELLECLINHCGVSIRSDDPLSLKNVIQTLHKNLGHLLKHDNDATNSLYENSRLRFMFEALTDLKHNKSRRIQTANADVVKKLRKWIGSIKSSLGQQQSGDTCLRLSLDDLLNAESKGRWWRTGAFWTGRTMTPFELEASVSSSSAAVVSNKQKSTDKEIKKSKAPKTEEDHLIELAERLGMNTTTRKKIFVVMMSSRDVTDAFERLSRLELKGKEDREVARILTQCCGQEKLYNGFYSELAKVLCTQERQYKITFKFVFWDMFKVVSEENDHEDDDPMNKNMNERKVVNLARMLSSLICSFHIPLSIIKPIEITNISPLLVLFLSTLLLAIFKEKITEEDYQNILDRVATTKDFAIVRDSIMFFLQRYIPDIPSGLDKDDTKQMKMRRKIAIKTFEAMSVLDVSRGLMKDDEYY